MNRTRQRPEPQESGSRTITLQETGSENSATPSVPDATPVGVLQLRATGNTSRRVVWSEETIDNEGMGKKKSKICCIYHKPKAFDESSDESSGSDSDSQSSDEEGSESSSSNSSEVNASKSLREKKGKEKADQALCDDDGCNGNHHKRGKGKTKKTTNSRSARTVTITESPKDTASQDEDHESTHRTFKPNAYEKGSYNVH
ncbi:uncharacterized protein FA14DRAFT_15325 [Meira miltonrushii]|uniref:Type 1 phosphatases regulator n=1 Tax=Meira miltonrushii TaxID=1280837 RepID=A0A316VIV1_9BASI|nr:uncharacterized protein FA14DRAFT_15325 [Meira miltonrushii]PWN37532.1 hypothetical protein FA14DRAFT_15325 [Meira miltonrushii]